jgi:hypothetical protein
MRLGRSPCWKGARQLGQDSRKCWPSLGGSDSYRQGSARGKPHVFLSEQAKDARQCRADQMISPYCCAAHPDMRPSPSEGRRAATVVQNIAACNQVPASRDHNPHDAAAVPQAAGLSPQGTFILTCTNAAAAVAPVFSSRALCWSMYACCCQHHQPAKQDLQDSPMTACPSPGRTMGVLCAFGCTKEGFCACTHFAWR